MFTTTPQTIRTLKQLPKVVRQPRPATSQTRPSFLVVLLRTLSAFAA
jgi:hypothetical protein